MSTQPHSIDAEERFIQRHVGYIGGLANPTQEAQHARLVHTNETTGINSVSNQPMRVNGLLRRTSPRQSKSC